MAPSQTVQVTSTTWTRDSHDLFDFEAASQLHSQSFCVQRSAICVRSGTEVAMVGEHSDPREDIDPDHLLRLVQRGGGDFWVDKAPFYPSGTSSSRKLWMVVRDSAPDGYALSEGEMIKLGRFKFRVRQLVSAASGDVQPDLWLGDCASVCRCTTAEGSGSQSDICRICLMEGPSEGDPLIRPCRCKGSIEFIHLKCLQYWIKNRLNLSEAVDGSYFYRPLACELCKSVYPNHVQFDSTRTPLVEVPRTEPPFVVLEHNAPRDSRHVGHGLHVISLAQKALLLGRGHESDVRIADVSISRRHATISFQQGQFVLKDNGSKFGTLVALKRPKVLEVGTPLTLQIGRTVLKLNLQPQTQKSYVTSSSMSAGQHAASMAPAGGHDPEAPESAGDGPARNVEDLRRSLFMHFTRLEDPPRGATNPQSSNAAACPGSSSAGAASQSAAMHDSEED